MWNLSIENSERENFSFQLHHWVAETIDDITRALISEKCFSLDSRTTQFICYFTRMLEILFYWMGSDLNDFSLFGEVISWPQ